MAPVSTDTTGRNRLVINLLLVATFVVILNETLMAVAIPRLMRDLEVTAAAVQWLTTAFLLTVSVVIPVTGFLLQRMNTRPVFVCAMSLFTLGTLIATLAANLQVLILARIVQASGTAIMVPLGVQNLGWLYSRRTCRDERRLCVPVHAFVHHQPVIGEA